MANDVGISLDGNSYNQVQQEAQALNCSMGDVILRIVQAHYTIRLADNPAGQPQKENPVQDLIHYFGIAVAESYLLMNDGQLGYAYQSLVRVAEDDPQVSHQQSRDLVGRYREARDAAMGPETSNDATSLTAGP